MISSEEFRARALERGLEETEHRAAMTNRRMRLPAAEERVLAENALLDMALDASLIDEKTVQRPDGRSDLAQTTLARALANSECEGPYDTSYLATLAAVVSAGAGNFPTAKVFAAQAARRGRPLGSFEAWVLQVLKDLSVTTLRESTSPTLAEYGRAEALALELGSKDAFDAADAAFEHAAARLSLEAEAGDLTLLMHWPLVRSRLRDLSTARVLSAIELPQAYRTALVRDAPLLYPSQVEAVERGSLLSPGRNTLLALPTSTGKSLLGELAIVSCLSSERPIGVYLAPYRALTDQVFSRMRPRLADAGIGCEARRGGYLSETDVKLGRWKVIVATPESFDGLLRQEPELRRQLACCVFDEFHLIEQQVRGLRYEGLIARLSAEPVGARAKLVGLSPVVESSEQLAAWLRLGEGDYVATAWKPTARRVAIVGPDRLGRYYTPADNLTGRSDLQRPAWVGEVPFPNDIQRAPVTRFHPQLRQHDLEVLANVVETAIDQYRRMAKPVLVVAATRAATRVIASRVGLQMSTTSVDVACSELAAELGRREPHLRTLRDCISKGVAYHNAGLPGWIRERLERLMEYGRLRIVVATTTLAEGVDLPFRVVVMADTRQFDGAEARHMSPLLFRNIAGRCGRAGAYAEGDTVIVDNPGRDAGAAGSADRLQLYFSNYVQPPHTMLGSALSRIAERGQEMPAEVSAALESQFIAYIDAVRPDGDELAAFGSSMFSGRFGASLSMANAVVAKFVDDMVAESQFVMMRRNSPLAVTPLGRVALISGLSPRSALAIAKAVAGASNPEEPGAGGKLRAQLGVKWNGLVAEWASLLVKEGQFVEELRDGAFRSVGRRNFPVTDANLGSLLMAWISGSPVVEIGYMALRSAGERSEMARWLSDGGGDSEWEEWVEQTAAFFSGYVAPQWSWVLKGAAAIAESVSPGMSLSLSDLSVRFEHGVRHALSARILALGGTYDRAVVDGLVSRCLADLALPEVSMEQLSVYLHESGDSLEGMPVGALGTVRVTRDTLSSVGELLRRHL